MPLGLFGFVFSWAAEDYTIANRSLMTDAHLGGVWPRRYNSTEVVMDLKDFIAATLSGIVEGVVEAQSKVQNLRAHVNPGGLMRAVASASSDAIWDNRTNNLARVVRFDIALNVEEGTGTHAKVGVVAGIFGLEAGGESQNRKVAVHRVEFAIPVLFPSSDLPEEARMRHKDDHGSHPSR